MIGAAGAAAAVAGPAAIAHAATRTTRRTTIETPERASGSTAHESLRVVMKYSLTVVWRSVIPWRRPVLGQKGDGVFSPTRNPTKTSTESQTFCVRAVSSALT